MPLSDQKCTRCGEPVGTSLGGVVCAACCFEQALSEQDTVSSGPAGWPRAFGRYELLDEVGRGGMGVVYRAEEPGLQRIVALKMLIAGEFADEAARKRLLREARAVARLAHPNIVSMYEVGEHEGRPYFTMEYVAGTSLGDQVRSGRPSITSLVAIVQKLAAAVHYAHTQGIVHRDLKPANVLMDERSEPKLTDFGLTKTTVDLTQTMVSAGSPNFMAPEQASHHRGPTGIHTDVFGLGAILYFCLTGRAPFAEESLGETLRAVMEEEPVPPRRLRNDVPLDLETICLKCLRKSPQERYRSALDVAEELERFRDSRPIKGRRIGWIGRVSRWYQREPVLGMALAGCVLLGTLLAFAVSARRNPALAKRDSARVESRPLFMESVAHQLTVASHPIAVVVDDFNRDGLPDLACISRQENVVETFFGVAGGQFRNGRRYATGLTPESLTEADVNGDGIPDLVSANSGADSLTILLGRGDGEFAASPESPVRVGAGPKEVVAGDLNKDGAVDLIVANFSANGLSVLIGDGRGHFQREPANDIPTGREPWGLAVGDINGDGWLDLANTDVLDGTVRLWLSNAGHGFSLKTNSILSSGTRPFHVALADMNGDGRLDVVSTATDDRLVHIFLQSQNGEFSERDSEPLFVADNFPRRIVTGDLNGDGVNDFAVVNESGSFTVFTGMGGGKFQMNGVAPYNCRNGATSLALADLNGDKQPDLVVLTGHPAKKNGNILFFLNQVGKK